MLETACYFAASGQCASLVADVDGAVCPPGHETVLSRIVKAAESGTLVLVITESKESEKAFTKMLCSHFAEKIETPGGSYVQFNISFIDNLTGDVVRYCCDRHSDIEGGIKLEHGRYQCCSLQASVTKPTEKSFAFTYSRLTLLPWGGWECTDDLVQDTESVVMALGIKITSVYVYFASGDALFLHRCLNMAKSFREVCRSKVFGQAEKVSSLVRLRDVRSWSIFVNEFYRFAPLLEGPYFINLNPRLVVGEKLAHAVSHGVSYILADGSNASPVDIVVSPLCGANGEISSAGKKGVNIGHRNIYSPHCRLTCKGDHVCIRPECGMTYVNGKLLSAEAPLQHNDRVVLGNDVVFRFVLVSASSSEASSSRILDWESCFNEFAQVAMNVMRDAECNELRREVISLKAESENLQRQLQLGRVCDDGALLILNNPPAGCQSPFVWQLGWMETGDSITIGPKEEIALPFLKSRLVIVRTKSGFSYTCNAVTRQLLHSQRFTIDNYIFILSHEPIVPPRKTVGTSGELHSFTENDVRELRNSLYELQWSLALLFDFAFPPKKAHLRKNSMDDLHHSRRVQLSSDIIMVEKRLKLTTVSRLVASMAEAIQMISSQLSDEMSAGTCPPKHDEIESGDIGSITRDLLEKLNGDARVSQSLFRRVHQVMGRFLIEMDTKPRSQNQVCDIPMLRLKNIDGPIFDELEEKFAQLKAKCFLASPVVLRRMKGVVDTLSISPDPKQLLDQYMTALDALVQPYSDISGIPAVKKQLIALALIDVILSTEYSMRNNLLASKEESRIEGRLQLWNNIADVCMGVFTKTPPLGHGASRSRGTAIQRKPTPRLHRVSMDTPTTTRTRAYHPGTPRVTKSEVQLSPKSKQLVAGEGAEAPPNPVLAENSHRRSNSSRCATARWSATAVLNRNGGATPRINHISSSPRLSFSVFPSSRSSLLQRGVSDIVHPMRKEGKKDP